MIYTIADANVFSRSNVTVKHVDPAFGSLADELR